MDKIGLRELRQDASEIIRRVESGEQIEINVAGRLAARLVPATPSNGSVGAPLLSCSPDRRTRTGNSRSICRHSLGWTVKALLDTSVPIATDVPALDGELAISAASLAELNFGVMVTADSAVRAERL